MKIDSTYKTLLQKCTDVADSVHHLGHHHNHPSLFNLSSLLYLYYLPSLPNHPKDYQRATRGLPEGYQRALMGFPFGLHRVMGYQSNPLGILKLIFVHFGALGLLCATQLMAGGWH